MGIAYKGIYKIDLKRKRYIDAIIQYNSQVHIEEITLFNNMHKFRQQWEPSSFGLQLSHLQTKIDNLLQLYSGGQEVEVKYFSMDSWGMYNVLLPIKESLRDEILRSEPSEKITTITSYIEHLIFSETNIGGLCPYVPEPPMYTLNRSEAMQVILRLPKVSQCIELPELNTIVFGSFEDQADVFYLQYGEKLNVESMHYPSFDIDSGFLSKYGFSENTASVVAAMQKYFQAWKDRDYEGAIFPQKLALDFNTDMKHDMSTISNDISTLETRKQNTEKNDQTLSTNIINNSLQAQNQTNCQVTVSTTYQDNSDQADKPLKFIKSYRPTKPHIWSEEDMRKSSEYEKHIRYDLHNLRIIDDIYETTVYLSKNHPDYREHPEPGWKYDENKVPRIPLSHIIIHHP